MESDIKADRDVDPNAMDDEDLEDGEIETDEENDVVEVKKSQPLPPSALPPPQIKENSSNKTQTSTEPTASSTAKKLKTTSSDEDMSSISKKENDAKNSTKSEHHHHHKSSSSQNSTNNISKKQTTEAASVRKPTDDDWMGDVENAIALALKKDGIEPKAPKVGSKSKESKSELSNSTKRGSKRRKLKRLEKELQLKKAKLTDDDSDKQYLQASNDSEDFDEYEMLNVRGGSPPAHSQGQSQSQKPQGTLYYDSDGSYSSYDSYDSSEHRARRQRSKRRANDRHSRSGNHRSNKSKREKRRRDDSDDEGGGPNINTGNMGGGGPGGNRNSNNNSNNNNKDGPRKQELCKFYLMECCAKGDKCLYMHGDFPCKFYYLGMKNHNRETCKFSHGKPLTDQLRNVLLKHLETAPKEIIGDFPRLSRENAVNMINAQHQKLLVKFGMEPDPNITASQSNIRLPSLLDLITKFPSPTGEHNSNSLSMNLKMKKDKPRKTRWCDQRPNDGSRSTAINQSSSSVQPNQSNENEVSLKSLTGVISPEQVENLAKLGIHTIGQLTQLTVLQVIELGLNIAQISELQISALNLQTKNAQLTAAAAAVSSSNVASNITNSSPAHETPKTLSTNLESSDQDMRIPLAQSTGENLNATKSHQINETVNQDIDMRILTIPQKVKSESIEQNVQTSNKSIGLPVAQSENNLRNFNTQYNKHSNDQPVNLIKNELPKIDYSQYLKDANLDSNQSDLEDHLGEDNGSRDLNHESDEDEADNSLIIEEEEEPLRIDESQATSDADNDNHNSHHLKLDREMSSSPKYDVLNNSNVDDIEINDQNKKRNSANEDTTSSTYSASSQIANQNADEMILPAVYAPASMFPTSVTNKIDLSSSVSQFLKKSNTTKETITKTVDNYVPNASDSSNDEKPDNGSSCRSPLSSYHRSDNNNFEFFTRQIPETNHPAPQALDEKTIEYDSSTENTPIHAASSPSRKPSRKSIYEWTDSDDDNEDGSRNTNIRSLSDQEQDDQEHLRNKISTSTISKDKDMRISSIFLDKDYSNGDIDLRLPFKPVMANYIPATEIDASITSHSPIAYVVKEVDIPKPDYSELRRSIPGHENTLDPRLRRILRLKEEQDSENTLFSNNKLTPFSPSSNESDANNHQSNPFSNSSSTHTTSVTQSNVKIENVCRPRIDPRRPNVQMNMTNHPTTTPPSVLNQPSTQQRSLHLDIQNILQKSNWYKDCSSKQKIMVNQQLAIVSTELKKFHADPSENKIFDLQFIIQNQLLQEVLTNLGIFISEDGEFVQLDQSNKDLQSGISGSGGNTGGGLVDLMSIPITSNLDLSRDFLRNQQKQQQHQQHQQHQQAAAAAAMHQAMGVMGSGPRYLGSPAGPPILGFGSVNLQNLQPDVIRPGLLGIAPNMPLPNPYNLFEPAQHNVGAGPFDPFFGRNIDGRASNANNDNRNSYRNSGGGGGNNNARWGGCNTNNNPNRDPSIRRNQFDRNNARRDKK